MLIATRLRGEEMVVRIPPSAETIDVIVRVMQIGDRKVRLGIQAPQYVEVDRREIRKAKDRDVTLANARSTRR